MLTRKSIAPAMAAALFLWGCIASPTGEPDGEQAAQGVGADGADSAGLGRELGTLVAIYPLPLSDGGYALELRMTRDTVIVDFAQAKAFASDSVGKALFLSTEEPFYTKDGRCFYSPKKKACLEYSKAAPAAPAPAVTP